MKTLRLLPVLLLALAIVGCATLQEAKPQTPREALAAVYLAIEEASNTVYIAKRDGHINADERDHLTTELVKAVHAVVDAEEALKAYEALGNPSDQDTFARNLSRANTVLRLIASTIEESQTDE